MKDITRSVLRYSRDILIVMIILVVLARTGNMPVLVPDKMTDFIIDVTSDLFSGRVFSSFQGFLSDIGDFFLDGGTDKHNRKNLELYRKRIELYFERRRRNLLYIAAHPDIRRSLPDFQRAFAAMYARVKLENTIQDSSDVDRMAVYTGTGQLIAEAKRTGLTNTPWRPGIKKLAPQVKSRRGVLVHFTTAGKILLATSFSSPFREKYGVLLLMLNQKGVSSQFHDLKKSKKFLFYCTDKDAHFFVGSSPGSRLSRKFKAELQKGARSIAFLQEERFITIAKETRRTYLHPLKFGEQKTELWLGLLGPDGNMLSFLLLMLRSGLLIGAIWLILFLMKKIFQLSRQILRDRLLSRKLQETVLEKSLAAGSRAEEAASTAANTARMASEAIGRSAGALHKTVVEQQSSQKSPPAADSE